MQFQVPQFIDTEDKVVGPLSLRQFGFVAIAGILSAILYFFAQLWLFVIGAIIFFGIAIALAFVKIEGRPFANIVISAFNFYWRPQTYIWQPEHKVAAPAKAEIKKEAGTSALAEILAKSTEKMKSAVQARQPAVRPEREPAPVAKPEPVSRETVSAGTALHKTWENMQTGAPLSKKSSDKEFIEKKMSERYQIFQGVSGDRHAAKRVDYR
jgi:hypothetical protein